MSHKDATKKSFRVIIKTSDYEKTMSSQFWVEGIKCREWVQWININTCSCIVYCSILCILSSLIMNTQLKIMSYNSRGLGGINCETIRQFLDDNNPDFVLMQETWLFKNNLQMLSGLHNEYMIHGKSFVPDDKILIGRPYGGLGILWRKSMALNVQAIDIITLIKFPASWSFWRTNL